MRVKGNIRRRRRRRKEVEEEEKEERGGGGGGSGVILEIPVFYLLLTTGFIHIFQSLNMVSKV